MPGQLWDGDGDGPLVGARGAIELETSRPGGHDAAATETMAQTPGAREAEDPPGRSSRRLALTRAVRHDLSPLRTDRTHHQLARYRGIGRAWLMQNGCAISPAPGLLFVEMPGLEPTTKGLALCHRLEEQLSPCPAPCW